jgi:NitT/TauT family transport system substrate-binding protein
MSASSSASPSGSFDALKPYPDAPGGLTEVKIAQSTPALSFAAMLIARDMNFFGYQGIKVSFVQLQSGTTSIQAVLGGSVDLTDGASSEIGGAVDKGASLLTIENTINQTSQVCVRKDWAQQHNVTPSSPLADRVKALKGATIGITGPGASSDRLARWLLKVYGDLNPSTDTTIVQVGGSSAQYAALDANQTQAFVQSPIGCGETKQGEILIKPSDVPEWADMTHEVLYGSKDWVQGHEDLAKKAATAVAMGDNFVLAHPDAALQVIEKNLPKLDPQTIAAAFKDTLTPQVPKDGKFSPKMIQAAVKVMSESGATSKPLDTTEGSWWTNMYIGDASVR